PKHSRPCRKVRIKWQEIARRVRCRHSRLRTYPSPEIFPARCLPSTFRTAEIRRPTHKFFLTNRRARRIRTPLRSANVCPPISRKLRRRDKRFAPPDSFLCL